MLTQITEIFETDKVKTGFEPIKADDLIEAADHVLCAAHIIDTLAVEREFAETWLARRELDYLICSDPAACAELAPCGDVEKYPDKGKKGQSTTEGRDIRSRPFLAENSLPEARIFELYDTPFSTVSTPSFTR